MDVGLKNLEENNKKGEMTEWFKVADCKSVSKCYRRFESYSLQKF